MRQSKQSYSKAGLLTVRVIQVVLFVTVILATVIIWGFMSNKEPSSFEVDNHSQDIGTTRSAFKIYKGQLLVAVPSGGYYSLAQADIPSLRLLSDAYGARHIAVDKNHVYCGNHVIAELNPATTRVIDQGYLTDGKYSYYCSPTTEHNPDLSEIQEVWQEILYNFGWGDKPLRYWNPIVKLEHRDTPYTIQLDGIASNGSSTYFRGQLMPHAKAGNTLYAITEQARGRSQARLSEHYSSDGQHVYFDQRLLGLKSNPDLLAIRFSLRDDFLFDAKTQNYYREDQAFPTENTPYQMLNPEDEHAYHALFLSPKGIYFYHQKDNKIKRAGDNPFHKELVRLGMDIYSDGQDTYFLSMEQKSVRSRHRRRLCWFATNLNRIENTPPESWQKLADVRYDIWQKGTLWRNRDRIYYFDELGHGQLFNSAVYQVMDAASAQRLQESIKDTDIRHMIREKKLVIPKVKDKIQAKENLRFCLFAGNLLDWD